MSHLIRASKFRTSRDRRSRELAEDYTELIAELNHSKGEARTCDISKSLGVSHVTALRALRRIEKAGFVKTTKHRPVSLTPKGRRLASLSKRRHELLVSFLVSIGVPTSVAAGDAEGMEHHLSRQTVRAIRRAMHVAQ